MPSNSGVSCLTVPRTTLLIMPEINRVAWNGRALVVGRGGLGTALAKELQRRQPALEVMLCGRTLGSADDECGN